MFTLSVFIEDGDGNALDGVVSVYDLNRALLVREASVAGIARVDIIGNGQMFVSVVTPVAHFSNFTITVPAEGEGEVTVVGEAVPKIPPIGPSWCSVEDTVRDIVGRPKSFSVQLSLLDGDTDVDGELVLDNGATAYSTEDGDINVHMLRGRSYRATLFDNSMVTEGSVYTIHVPNRAHARFYDILYPYPVGGFVDGVFVGEGDYVLTIIMSDGRELTTFSDITVYIYSIEASNNEEATLSETEEGGALLSVTGPPGVGVVFTCNRRGSALSAEGAPLGPGEVFFSLVS